MQKIGFYDSGIGGLTILSEFNKLNQHIPTIYFADQAACPLGDKSPSQIKKHVLHAVDYLFQQGCDVVVLACNTATAYSIRYIQQKWLPEHYPNKKVLGIIRPVTQFLQDKITPSSSPLGVGVMATQATINSNFYTNELSDFFADSVCVYNFAAPGLADAIEKNDETSITKLLEAIFPVTDYTKLKEINFLILACTHYPIIKESIACRLLDIFQKNGFSNLPIQIISQSNLVSLKLYQYILNHPEIFNFDNFESESAKNSAKKDPSQKSQKITFITTGNVDNFKVQISLHFPHLLQQNPSVEYFQ